jgi:UDP-3-O-[3-hydroxymyristoyl] glucosamine N-acyltransferase
MKLGEIAKRLGCQLEGDSGIEISGIAGIEDAGPGQLTFLSNPRYRSAVRSTRASALFIAQDGVIERDPGMPPLAALRSANAYLDFARAIELFHKVPRYAPGIHPTAVIAPTARVGASAHIGPYCFVDNGVEIGRNAVLHSFVTVYRDAHIGDDFLAHSHVVVREACRIGNRVILQNGVVIGADGFGFAREAGGHWYKIFAAGISALGDDVEIQANSCVDRATLGETRVDANVKIDDFVLVGHGSHIGEGTVISAQAGFAGTTEVGKNCMIGGQVGCSGHLTIGDGAMLTPQSGVHNDIPAGKLYSGAPAVEHKQWLKNSAAINHVTDLMKTVRRLEAEVENLKARLPL